MPSVPFPRSAAGRNPFRLKISWLEARILAQAGVKELLLIAQDLTSYGTDLDGKKHLPELLEQLVSINGPEWIRLHYTYPLGFPSTEMIRLMKAHPKICRYLDIPVQHVNDNILKAMNRGHGRTQIEKIIEAFRNELPDITVRSTVITGFPGEGKKEFEELKSFIRSVRFDRLGVFTYSHEENTPAAKRFRDVISDKTKKHRLEELMGIQQEISLELNAKKIGTNAQGAHRPEGR